MDLGNAEEIDRADLEKEKHLSQNISNQTETSEQMTNVDGVKESDEVNKFTVEEHQNDSVTVVLEKNTTEEIDNELATHAEKGESNVSIENGKDIVNEVNEELSTVVENEKTETEENSKKRSPVDDDETEPEPKKSKSEVEQEITTVESSTCEPPFPPEFCTEVETEDCDQGPLWHFDDPHLIELVQVGNPPKDVAYVRSKTDKDA